MNSSATPDRARCDECSAANSMRVRGRNGRTTRPRWRNASAISGSTIDTPTPEAHLLLAEVERYAYGIQAVSDFAEELRNRRRGMLRIVSMPALAVGFLPRFVASFIRGRQLGHVYVHGMPSHLVTSAHRRLSALGQEFVAAFRVHAMAKVRSRLRRRKAARAA